MYSFILSLSLDSGKRRYGPLMLRFSTVLSRCFSYMIARTDPDQAIVIIPVNNYGEMRHDFCEALFVSVHFYPPSEAKLFFFCSNFTAYSARSGNGME